MRVLISTPLYPPDIEPQARYVKELAIRLSDTHEVTLLTYGRIPERIPRVTIHAVPKHIPLVVRLIVYTRALWSMQKSADAIFSENGASVELPLMLVSLLSRVPIVFHEGDVCAQERNKGDVLFKTIHRLAARGAKKLTGTPLQKPEVFRHLPFPKTAYAAYADSWQKHILKVNRLLHA